MTTFTAADGDDGDRLDVVVARRLDISRSQAASRIAAGEVVVDGEPVGKSHLLGSGQVVTVRAPARPADDDPPPLPRIVYRDEHLLVVSKPAGLVVHPGSGHSGDTLVDALQAAGIPLAAGTEHQRPGIVHRLDRETSGLMLVASTEQAHRGLVAALAERRVQRRYVAIVDGVPGQTHGRIEGPIGRDPDHRTRFAVVEGGRDAVTRYRVLDVGQIETANAVHQLAWLGLALETGRTHQIRVHLRAIGHPVTGDRLYGAAELVARQLGLGRQALHATALSLRHPIDGRELDFVEPAADDIVAAAARARIDHTLGLVD